MRIKALKIIINILMVASLIICMPSSHNGDIFQHIIAGFTFTTLAILHFSLNRKWFMSISKAIQLKKLKGSTIRQYIIDWLLITVWVFSIITGFLGLVNHVFVGMHGVSARLGCLLIIVHIFQHRKKIISYLSRRKKRSTSK